MGSMRIDRDIWDYRGLYKVQDTSMENQIKKL